MQIKSKSNRNQNQIKIKIKIKSKSAQIKIKIKIHPKSSQTQAEIQASRASRSQKPEARIVEAAASGAELWWLAPHMGAPSGDPQREKKSNNTMISKNFHLNIPY